MLAADKPTSLDDWINRISKHFGQSSASKEVQAPLPDPDHTASVRYYVPPAIVGAAEIPLTMGMLEFASTGHRRHSCMRYAKSN